jgi:hypothetical protein
MHVVAISTISDRDRFWGSLKRAYDHLPEDTRWTLAVGSNDGIRAVNVFVHDSVEGVRRFFEAYAGSFGSTEYFEADASNAVGLPG